MSPEVFWLEATGWSGGFGWIRDFCLVPKNLRIAPRRVSILDAITGLWWGLEIVDD